MKITRKRELIIERERRVTIKFGNSSAEKFCSACNQTAQFVTIDEASILRQMSARQIFRLIEAESVHFNETENGLLTVCTVSLADIKDEKIIPNH